MQISKYSFSDGARLATGLTVVIDVFRAFSTACYLFNCGASKVFAVGDLDLAYTMRENIPGSILVGERDERKPEGFDYGNSPLFIKNEDLAGKVVVLTTSAGTQGITNATSADEIITGSFVNAEAVCNYIKWRNPEQLSLVCMGFRDRFTAEEDEFFAEYLVNRIEGKPNHYPEMVSRLKNGSGTRFFNPDAQEYSPSEDFYLCTDLDRFDFVLRAEQDAYNQTELRKTIYNQKSWT
jgi:2-phosphosulfolactate phosphatase